MPQADKSGYCYTQWRRFSALVYIKAVYSRRSAADLTAWTGGFCCLQPNYRSPVSDPSVYKHARIADDPRSALYVGRSNLICIAKGVN